MKKNIYYIVTVIVLCILAVNVDAFDTDLIQAESLIKSVTVYPDRAIVRRTTTVDVLRGKHNVSFGNLPFSLVDTSLRVICSSPDARADILGIESHIEYIEEFKQDKINKLEEEINSYQLRARKLSDQIEIINSNMNFIQSIQEEKTDEISSELNSENFSVSSWDNLLDYIAQKLSMYYKDIRDIRDEQSEIDKKIGSLKKELIHITQAPLLMKKQVIINVDVKSPGKLSLEMSYIVFNAQWFPTYNARADIDNKKVYITYVGLISQDTGEEWSDVAITLSTAKPSACPSLPDLNSWYLYPFSTYKASSPAAFQMDSYDMSKEVLKEERFAFAPLPGETESNTIIDLPELAGHWVVYDIELRRTIADDNILHTVPIGVKEFPLSLNYVSAPKLSPYVYVKSEVKNTTDVFLLQGKMNIFVGSDYMGKSVIDNVPPQDMFDLYLGTDEEFNVKHELIYRKEGFRRLSTKKFVTCTYKITIESNKSAKENVSIIDSLPVSQHKDIKVDIYDISLAPTRQDAEKGIYTWDVTLDPQQKKEIIYTCTIEYPSSWTHFSLNF